MTSLRKFLWTLCLAVVLVPAVLPQSSPRVVASGELRSTSYAGGDIGRVRDLFLDSKLMARKMNFRVVLPSTYDDKAQSGRIYPVLYLLHGLTGHFEDWSQKTGLVGYSSNRDWIIVTPEGNNGWYSDSVTVPNDKYESYIIKELVPEVENRYRAIAGRRGRAIAGLSMGGYGALKFALKYPEMFRLVGSFSGALGAASFNSKNAGSIGQDIDAILGPEESEMRKANDIFRLVRELTAERLKTIPYIYLSCGTEDFLIQNNRDFLALLNEKKVPHEYREHPGVHDWSFWDDQIREFIEVAGR
jgi:S-formylglutathione hydrolase FrmB